MTTSSRAQPARIVYIAAHLSAFKLSDQFRRHHRRFWHATLKIAYRHMSTSASTEGGSEPNLLLRGA